mmetsp:Transcript_33374/g.107222  ORF Transcript_33374/g.107222 Transcript_33374/m.107222 type:complete len:276 (+) Transcript_33374:355-1182(+)
MPLLSACAGRRVCPRFAGRSCQHIAGVGRPELVGLVRRRRSRRRGLYKLLAVLLGDSTEDRDGPSAAGREGEEEGVLCLAPGGAARPCSSGRTRAHRREPRVGESLLGSEPFLLRHAEQAAQQALQLRLRGELWCLGVRADGDALEELDEGGALEGHPPCGEEVERDAGCPHVHLEAREGVGAVRNLGRLEGRRAARLRAGVGPVRRELDRHTWSTSRGGLLAPARGSVTGRALPAAPKSQSLSTPAEETSAFCGLMSRCTTPRSWQHLTAWRHS